MITHPQLLRNRQFRADFAFCFPFLSWTLDGAAMEIAERHFERADDRPFGVGDQITVSEREFQIARRYARFVNTAHSGRSQ